MFLKIANSVLDFTLNSRIVNYKYQAKNIFKRFFSVFQNYIKKA